MTTPTHEAIEVAARAMYAANNGIVRWAALLGKDYWRKRATAALSAAYPLMEAQTKVEALREAADAFGPDEWDATNAAPQEDPDASIDGIGVVIEWLRARAATIEGKDS